MKNPSITAAFVLVALALVVGGVALSAGGSGDDSVNGPVLTAPDGPQKATFENLSPHEARKKGRLEAAERELDKVKRIGKEVRPNVYKIKDDSGDPTYYLGSLIKGVGRNGEPLYLSAQFKRLPAMPLKELPKLPAKLTPKLKPKVTQLPPLHQPTDGSGAPGDGSGHGDQGKTVGGTTGG